ncbi:MAG: SDR family NAD(P)-dependent oxidoreductase [Bacillota bacterium]|nr:SDR family NAD(P)-dependent oxidoreductase [Bacillota bacterium]
MSKYNFLEILLFPPVNLEKKKLKSKITGKTVLITGASSGIGEQLAYQLASFDVHLVLVARTEAKLMTMKNKIEKEGAKVSIFQADLRNEEELEGLLEFLHHIPNGLDIIVSNAGISIRRSICDSLDRYHDFTRTMAINYFAPVKLLLSIIPLLKQSKGQVINISTVNTLLIPVPYWAAYQASKSAFDTWFRSVAPELNAMGIATTSIYLPLVKTPMIMPTAAYQNMPAMCPSLVAQIICKSMYTRRHKYMPWWLLFGQLASTFFRGIWEVLMPGIIKKKG